MAQPPDPKQKTGLQEARADYGPTSDEELGPADRTERLRLAVEEAGGQPAVARLSGIPLSTLKRFVEGQDAKFGAMISLARVLGVRLEWLASGQGPMRPGEAAPDHQVSDLDEESLVAALEMAEVMNPEAPAEARAKAALIGHEKLRRQITRNHPPAPIDPDLFARCLAFAEQLLVQSGRLGAVPAARRLRVALGAYRLAREEMRSESSDT